MSTTTSNLGLFKYDTTNSTDLASAFNINTALNANWDKIDTAIAGGGLPDQTDKAGYLLTTDGTNASWGETGEIYPVVETYINGESWYRVYSDGWCEQGITTNVSAGATYTWTFLKPYINIYYQVFTQDRDTLNTTSTFFKVSNKTTGSVQTKCVYTSGEINGQFYACGYII